MTRSADIRLTVTPDTARQLLADLERLYEDRVARLVDADLIRWPGEVIVLTITDPSVLRERDSQVRWLRLLKTGRKLGLHAVVAPDADPIPGPFGDLIPASESSPTGG